MDFHINELDSMNPYELPHNNNAPDNYWETVNKNTKKKKVTFTDILSNMNLVVNKQGVLQYMGINEEPAYQQQQPQPIYATNAQAINNQIHTNNQPIDPSVKHSYIYNKYFKDYSDPNTYIPEPRVPKTIEEYRKMVLEDRIKEIQHKKRIEQIKSKKLLFTTTPGASSNPRNIVVNQNGLRRMKFG